MLEQLLEHERSRRDYFENLLLVKAGILNDSEQSYVNLEEMPSVRKFVTLSGIRRELERKHRTKLTKAEETFEKELNDTTSNG